jgi:hypothetical protein
MEVSGQLHAPGRFTPGKDPWYPVDRRLGGPQSRSRRGGEKKYILPPAGRPARSPVTILTELPRLPILDNRMTFQFHAPSHISGGCLNRKPPLCAVLSLLSKVETPIEQLALIERFKIPSLVLKQTKMF